MKALTNCQNPKKKDGPHVPFFQPKLTVNQPNDEYEQEADAVADRVMRMREGDMPIVQRTPLTAVTGLQKACAHCEEEQKAQRKATGGDASGKAAPSVVSDVLASGGGQPMDGGTRQFMESRMGQDFSQVRIHTDRRAAESASAIQAKAYTSGRDVVFGAGEYRPDSDAGKRLLAHELVHVGQQERSLIKRGWFKQYVANGRVDNRSNSAVRVWSSDRGHYTVAAHTITPFSGEDVDHIQDRNEYWYKIGVGTVIVNEEGVVSNAQCQVVNWGDDCPPHRVQPFQDAYNWLDRGIRGLYGVP